MHIQYGISNETNKSYGCTLHGQDQNTLKWFARPHVNNKKKGAWKKIDDDQVPEDILAKVEKKELYGRFYDGQSKTYYSVHKKVHELAKSSLDDGCCVATESRLAKV